MMTRFQEIFKGVDIKKPMFRNLLFTVIAISVAKTFRINEIASRLPIDVDREKSKQKRLLWFLGTPGLLVDALRKAWFVSVMRWFFKNASDHLHLLVDETKLIDGWQATEFRFSRGDPISEIFGN